MDPSKYDDIMRLVQKLGRVPVRVLADDFNVPVRKLADWLDEEEEVHISTMKFNGVRMVKADISEWIAEWKGEVREEVVRESREEEEVEEEDGPEDYVFDDDDPGVSSRWFDG